MSVATTRGIILQAEFAWIIRDILTWPELEGEKLISPLFHAVNDEEIKWSLAILMDPWSTAGRLGLFLCLSESPLSKPKITARFSCAISDHQSGNLLFQKAIDGVSSPFSKPSNNSVQHLRSGRFPMDCRERFLEIPSISIHVIVEYEKEQMVEQNTCISNAVSSLDSGNDHPNCWLADFENLFISQSGSDVSFIIDRQEIKAHKTILSARSPVFAAMFHSDMKERVMDRIDIPDISPDIFNELLRFIYTDRVELTESNPTSLLAAADKYLLQLLKIKCEEFLIKGLSVENCIEMMTLADLHTALNLKKMTEEYFRSHHTEIRKTESWKVLKMIHPDIAFDIVERLLDV